MERSREPGGRLLHDGSRARKRPGAQFSIDGRRQIAQPIPRRHLRSVRGQQQSGRRRHRLSTEQRRGAHLFGAAAAQQPSWQRSRAVVPGNLCRFGDRTHSRLLLRSGNRLDRRSLGVHAHVLRRWRDHVEGTAADDEPSVPRGMGQRHRSAEPRRLQRDGGPKWRRVRHVRPGVAATGRLRRRAADVNEHDGARRRVPAAAQRASPRSR